MTLFAVVLATLACGIGSVWLAAALLRAPGFATDGSAADVQRQGAQHLLSLAAGALMATAFMHLLPEAFESQAGAKELFATLLVGVLFFFLLDKAELWHHGHEHHHEPGPPAHGDAHDHAHGHDRDHAHGHVHGHGHSHVHAHGPAPTGNGRGAWALLTGDSVHCFGDGVLIASAFIAHWRLGLVAAVAVLAHEVPHHMGDLVVLQRAGGNRRMALIKVSLAGSVTAIGGVVGYHLVDSLQDLLPYFLAVASSSFIYVALADLIPQLQRQLSLRETAVQVGWLALGVAMVSVISAWAH